LNTSSSQEPAESVKDLTFITNESGNTLFDRFKTLIKDTKQFDVLVAYFFISGFYKIYPSLETVDKIRIIVGINTDRKVSELVNMSSSSNTSGINYSSAESKQITEEYISREMENCEDSLEIEEGIYKFLEWLKSGKLEIKALPSERIHSKVYIMTFNQGDRDKGRVITGSSNLTSAGLIDNFEFNVELKNYSDYKFAKDKFEDLWLQSVDIKDKYIDTIQVKTWLNDTITPYELYLKFLYEYFQKDLRQPEEITYNYLPPEFMKLEYQEQAVLNSKKILDEYGGVFISDVVGSSFEVRYYHFEKGSKGDYARHDREYFFYILHGCGQIKINDDLIDVKSNDFVYLSPNELVQIIPQENKPFGFLCVTNAKTKEKDIS